MKRDIKFLIIHRIEINHADYSPDASGVTCFFETGPGGEYTGGKMPYHYVIDQAGETIQCVEHSVSTPHARSYNPKSIGIAVYGDFRKEPPTHAQLFALVKLLTTLADCYPHARIAGHTELPNASSDPNKECPGKYLPVGRIKTLVKSINAIANGWGASV